MLLQSLKHKNLVNLINVKHPNLLNLTHVVTEFKASELNKFDRSLQKKAETSPGVRVLRPHFAHGNGAEQ